MTRPQKLSLGEMRRMGIRGLLVYCSDYKCSHSTAIGPIAGRTILGCLGKKGKLCESG